MPLFRSLLLALCALLTACAGAPPAPLNSSIDGPLTTKEIEKAFAGYQADFRKMLDSAGRGKAWRTGTLKVSFSITPAGWVRDLVLTHSDIHNSSFEEDVLLQISLMRFPQREEVTTVSNYPMAFHKNQPARPAHDD